MAFICISCATGSVMSYFWPILHAGDKLHQPQYQDVRSCDGSKGVARVTTWVKRRRACMCCLHARTPTHLPPLIHRAHAYATTCSQARMTATQLVTAVLFSQCNVSVPGYTPVYAHVRWWALSHGPHNASQKYVHSLKNCLWITHMLWPAGWRTSSICLPNGA